MLNILKGYVDHETQRSKQNDIYMSHLSPKDTQEILKQRCTTINIPETSAPKGK